MTWFSGRSTYSIKQEISELMKPKAYDEEPSISTLNEYFSVWPSIVLPMESSDPDEEGRRPWKVREEVKWERIEGRFAVQSNVRESIFSFSKERLASLKRKAWRKRSASPPLNLYSRFTRDETTRQKVDQWVHGEQVFKGYADEDLVHSLDENTMYDLYNISMKHVNFLSSFYNYWSYVQQLINLQAIKDWIPSIISKMIERALLPHVDTHPRTLFEKVTNNKMILHFSLNQHKNPDHHQF